MSSDVRTVVAPRLTTLLVLLAVLSAGCGAIAELSTHAGDAASPRPDTEAISDTTTSTTATATTTTATTTAPTTTPSTTMIVHTTTTTAIPETTTIGAEPPVAEDASGVLAIGDSVMQASSNLYCGTLPASISGLEIYGIDGMVSRQFGAAEGIVAERIAAGQTPRVLIVHLGTNGPVSTTAFDALMAVAAPIPEVVFVTIKVPRSHVASSNDALRSGVSRYTNAALVDWEAASEDHPEYFSNEEQFHLNCDPGAKAYASLIAQEV